MTGSGLGVGAADAAGEGDSEGEGSADASGDSLAVGIGVAGAVEALGSTVAAAEDEGGADTTAASVDDGVGVPQLERMNVALAATATHLDDRTWAIPDPPFTALRRHVPSDCDRLHDPRADRVRCLPEAARCGNLERSDERSGHTL